MSSGRADDLTGEPDLETGRVVYRTGAGAFTVEPTSGSDWLHDDPDRVRVWYGLAPESGWHNGREPLPHAPVIFRVTLVGGAVFDPAKALTDEPWFGLPVHRQGRDPHSAPQAPDGVRKVTTMLVREIVRDWLARDDLEELRAAHARFLAPARLAEARRRRDAAEKTLHAAQLAALDANRVVRELMELIPSERLEDVPF